jgi:hypothetical protein
MWQNEYYYLDGTVTLHMNEHGTDDNLLVGRTIWNGVVNDITRPPSPDPAKGRVRYGEVRDTGGADAPVPQYLTRNARIRARTLPSRGAASITSRQDRLPERGAARVSRNRPAARFRPPRGGAERATAHCEGFAVGVPGVTANPAPGANVVTFGGMAFMMSIWAHAGHAS